MRTPQRGVPTSKSIRLISFDFTTDAAAFALEHGAELGYVAGYESSLVGLVQNHSVKFNDGLLNIEWTLVLGDFPTFLSRSSRATATCEPEHRLPARREPVLSCEHAVPETGAPPPHAILFDPHSPKKNPAMWTATLFAGLFHRLDPQRPCALATYTRSTMARTALLLGGFFVGMGHPSGLKEETTRLQLLTSKTFGVRVYTVGVGTQGTAPYPVQTPYGSNTRICLWKSMKEYFRK